MILNDDEGNYQYACFTNGIKKDNDLRKIKGKDFRQILNTDVLLDYTEENSFSPILYDILEKVCEKIFLSEDETISKIEMDFITQMKRLKLIRKNFSEIYKIHTK